ncbi:MAG: MmcB family DNA repair protein [Aestuariivirga sp.]
MARQHGVQVVELRPDLRQSATAAAVQRGACRLLRTAGFATVTEFTLVTGRRADIFALGRDGEIWIVEIKSSIEDFRADHKWNDYRDFCDKLYFAIPQSLDPLIIPEAAGLIVADAYGADIQRQPEPHPLHASRRKAVTLQFARAAALRLHSLYDPEAEVL